MTTSTGTTSSAHTAGVTALAAAGLVDIVTGVLLIADAIKDDPPPTLLFIPAFSAGAPTWVTVLGIIVYVFTLAGVLLTIPALRRRPAVS